MQEIEKPKKDMTNVQYNPEWPLVFESIKNILLAKLGDTIIDIVHVGSTAIPGLSGKPRLDIDAIINSQEELPEVIEKLKELGYYPQGNLGRAGREAFGRLDDSVPYDSQGAVWMKHNLYVCPKDSDVLHEHFLFRDYLRKNPDIAVEYGKLKFELAEKYRNDQDAYVSGKNEFVGRILSKLREQP